VAWLREIAADQWGLVTRRQARDAGVPATTLDRLTSPGSILIRVAHGVYRMAGAPEPDHLDLRAAWLQLAPSVPAWQRTTALGVVSHRSAASVYDIGNLPADVHEFTFPARRQTRRADVRVRVRPIKDSDCDRVRGLPLTRPARIASDLFSDREDPEAVAQIIVDALQQRLETPDAFATELTTHASRHGFRFSDGIGFFGWLLSLVPGPDNDRWLDRAHTAIAAAAVTGARTGR